MRRALIAVGAVVALAAASAVGAPPARAATVYVISPSGSDTAAGTSGAPFKTIQKCATVAVAGDVCEIQSGTYRETVRPTNSGTAAAPIVFREAPGATVTIDGTNAVSGWTVDSGNIYKATVTLAGTAAAPYSSTPLPSNTELWANQVFSNGAEVLEAAWPAPNPNRFVRGAGMNLTATNDTFPDCRTEFPCPMITQALTNPSFPALGDMTGATAIFSGYWTSLSASVTGGNLTASNKTITISYPTVDKYVRPSVQPTMQLIGKKQFLTGANQFFYDAATTTLFVRTAGGAPSGIAAKARNYAFDLNDRDFIKVERVSIFASTIRTNEGSTGDVIDGITANYISHFQTAQYDRNKQFSGTYYQHRFDSGILLHGSNNSLINSEIHLSAGNGVNLSGPGHVVRNNLITDTDYKATYTSTVSVEDGTNNISIVFNTLRTTGRDGINLIGSVGHTGNRIAYNDVSDYGKLADDLGGIYVCCKSSENGSRYDHNWLHDPAFRAYGLYYDNGTYAVSADHNVVWGLKGLNGDWKGSTFMNGGRGAFTENIPYNEIHATNNTFVSGASGTIRFHSSIPSDSFRAEATNNILDGRTIGSQVFAHPEGGSPDVTTNLSTTRSFNGGGTNPLYIGSAGANLSLQAGSPAVDAGTVVPGITDGFAGAAPDQGAYESGQARWMAGCSFAGCGDAGSAAYSVLLSGQTGKVVRDDTTVVQATLGTSWSHLWQVARDASGLYTFTNRLSSECLAVPASTGAGAVSSPCSASAANQKWRLVEAGFGQVQIVNNSTGLCLAVSGGSGEGAPVAQNTCSNVQNQKFLVPKVS